MPDPAIDPSTALAPPPGWTPPPAPAMGGAPQLPIPVQPPVTQAAPTPQQPSTDPEIQAGAAHQDWLAHIMSTVGSILGGDTTLHVTKHPDGSIDVTHDPSTSSEKWGRIAQAALTGGAAGMAAGQGPGGTPRAIAAGVQTGAQQGPQALAAANQEATAANAQMMTKAQHALLDQQIATAQLQAKELPQEYAEKRQAFALDQTARLRDMGAIHVANTKNAEELAQFGNSDPLSRAAHTGASDDVMHPVAMPDGSTDWWRIPADVSKQYTTTDSPWEEHQHDPSDYGKVKIIPHMSLAGSITNGNLALRDKGLTVANNTVDKDAADYRINKQKADTEATNAQGKPGLIRAQTQEALARAGEASRANLPVGGGGGAAGPGESGVMGSEFGGGDPNSTFERNAQMLANGDQVLSQVRIMRGKGQPTQQDYVARADQIDRANGGTGYLPAQVGIEYKQANEAKRQAAINAIDRAIGRPGQPGQIDQLIGLSDKAHLSNAPLIGGLINSGQLNAGNVAGDKNAQNLLNSIEDTRATFSALIGNPLLGGGETDKKLERAKAMIGNYPTPDNLRSAKNDVLVPALRTQRDALTSGNRFLTRMYGSSTQLSPMEQRRRQPTPTPAVATAPPAAAAAAPSTFNWNSLPKVQ